MGGFFGAVGVFPPSSPLSALGAGGGMSGEIFKRVEFCSWEACEAGGGLGEPQIPTC